MITNEEHVLGMVGRESQPNPNDHLRPQLVKPDRACACVKKYRTSQVRDQHNGFSNRTEP